MKCRLVFVMISILFLTSIEILAQQGSSGASTPVAFSEAPADVAFWVAYWGKPRVALFGPEQEAFNQNVHEIMFPWNDHDGPSNPNNVWKLRLMHLMRHKGRVRGWWCRSQGFDFLERASRKYLFW